MSRIASAILKLTEQHILYSDLQLRQDGQSMYRAPKQYLPISDPDDPDKPLVLTYDDMCEFAAFLDDGWRARLDNKEDINVAIPVEANRLRVSLYKLSGANQKPTLGMTIRRHPLEVAHWQQLGVPSAFVKLATSNMRGLLLVNGRTNGGKTTTQMSIIDHIAKQRSVHVETLEDPCEYKLPDYPQSVVTQREKGAHFTSFVEGIEGSKRHTPDVLLIGEIRDRDTMSATLQAADSGALVLATLHGRSAREALDFIQQLYPASEHKHIMAQLSNLLLGVLSQALLPSTDGKTWKLAYELMVVQGNNPIQNNIRDMQLQMLNGSMQLCTNASGEGLAGGCKQMNIVLEGLIKSKQVDFDDALLATCDQADLISRNPVRRN